MLVLVHPRPRGQGGDPPRRKFTRSAALMLTDAEAARVRSVVRHLAKVHGSLGRLAEASGLNRRTLRGISCGSQRATAALALALARVARTTVDRVLSGKPASADRCPTCGAKREGGT